MKLFITLLIAISLDADVGVLTKIVDSDTVNFAKQNLLGLWNINKNEMQCLGKYENQNIFPDEFFFKFISEILF